MKKAALIIAVLIWLLSGMLKLWGGVLYDLYCELNIGDIFDEMGMLAFTFAGIGILFFLMMLCAWIEEELL